MFLSAGVQYGLRCIESDVSQRRQVGELRMAGLMNETDLHAIYKPPSGGAVGKDIAQIGVHFANFIALSPFLCIGTTSKNGLGDVSPRGGEPGFVHVLDNRTRAMPDRPGNNRLDSLGNITRSPGVGLLFFVPGFQDTLRVNGAAGVTTDPELLQRFTADGKPPRSVVVIDVKEAYLHSGKAIKRAGLWTPEALVDSRDLPDSGRDLSRSAEAGDRSQQDRRGAREGRHGQSVLTGANSASSSTPQFARAHARVRCRHSSGGWLRRHRP
jgi:hypothetical protein